MKNLFMILEMNQSTDCYEQLTYAISEDAARSYLDKVCTLPSTSYLIVKIIEEKFVAEEKE